MSRQRERNAEHRCNRYVRFQRRGDRARDHGRARRAAEEPRPSFVGRQRRRKLGPADQVSAEERAGVRRPHRQEHHQHQPHRMLRRLPQYQKRQGRKGDVQRTGRVRQRRFTAPGAHEQIAQTSDEQDRDYAEVCCRASRRCEIQLPPKRGDHREHRDGGREQEVALGKQPVPFPDRGGAAERQKHDEGEAAQDCRADGNSREQETEQRPRDPVHVEFEALAPGIALPAIGRSTPRPCDIRHAAHATASGATAPKRRSLWA